MFCISNNSTTSKSFGIFEKQDQGHQPKIKPLAKCIKQYNKF